MSNRTQLIRELMALADAEALRSEELDRGVFVVRHYGKVDKPIRRRQAPVRQYDPEIAAQLRAERMRRKADNFRKRYPSIEDKG